MKALTKKRRTTAALSLLTLLPAAMVTVPGCGGGGGSTNVPSGVAPGTYQGQSVAMGNGTAQSFVTIGNDGKPAALGVTLSAGALTGLPTQLPELRKGISYVVQYPAQASQTAYNHMELRYWPRGHDPEGVLSLEHIDFVSSLLTPQQRDQITAQGSDLAKVLKTPQADYIPVGFAPIPSVDFAYSEARFGTRYFDVKQLTPVLTGEQTFTTAVFYGYYNGAHNFVEIPVTFDRLKASTESSGTFAPPKGAAKPGYYATRFRVLKNATTNEETFLMDNFVYRG